MACSAATCALLLHSPRASSDPTSDHSKFASYRSVQSVTAFRCCPQKAKRRKRQQLSPPLQYFTHSPIICAHPLFSAHALSSSHLSPPRLSIRLHLILYRSRSRRSVHIQHAILQPNLASPNLIPLPPTFRSRPPGYFPACAVCVSVLSYDWHQKPRLTHTPPIGIGTSTTARSDRAPLNWAIHPMYPRHGVKYLPLHRICRERGVDLQTEPVTLPPLFHNCSYIFHQHD